MGAAFGVVLVLHKGFCFEVATFRKDEITATAADRTPSILRMRVKTPGAVTTMNGLFEEPFRPSGGIVDYVDGVADIEAGILRAIRESDCRFEERFPAPDAGGPLAVVTRE